MAVRIPADVPAAATQAAVPIQEDAQAEDTPVEEVAQAEDILGVAVAAEAVAEVPADKTKRWSRDHLF